MKIPVLFVVTAMLAGCFTPPQMTVHPFSASNIPSEICVIENDAVRSGFLPVYMQALRDKGISVTLLEPGSQKDQCEWTSTYTGDWDWDIALYLASAEIFVYKDDWPEGEASYNGGLGMGKFSSAEEIIQDMVNQLFPSLQDEPASAKE